MANKRSTPEKELRNSYHSQGRQQARKSSTLRMRRMMENMITTDIERPLVRNCTRFQWLKDIQGEMTDKNLASSVFVREVGVEHILWDFARRDFVGCGGYSDYEYGNECALLEILFLKKSCGSGVTCREMNRVFCPSATKYTKFAESGATEIEITSATNTQITTATDESITQGIELKNKHDCIVRYGIWVPKNKSSVVEEICCGVDQQYSFAQRSETSLNVRGEGLNNGMYRASADSVITVHDETCINSRFASRWRSLSLPTQNCNYDAILTMSENMNAAVDTEKVASISENDLSVSDTRFLSKYSHHNQHEILLTSEHQKIPLRESRDCVSLTEERSNFSLSSEHNNKNFNDFLPLDNISSSMDLHIPTPKNNDIATEETATVYRDQYSETKEPIVTQSLEDTNRAVSVLNVMLQRRLNNSGSQNGFFTQEVLHSFYSTSPGDSKLPQKILNFQSFVKTNGLNDFVDKNDAPSSIQKDFAVGFEIEERAAAGKQQYECMVQVPQENLLKRYRHENGCGNTPQKSNSNGRSTIRDRLPRGQTRKLASMFETMNDAASVEMLREMDHLKRRGLTVSCKRNGFEKECIRDKRIIQTYNVRSIVNRFESVSTPNKYRNSPRTLQVDITPRKPTHQKRYSRVYNIARSPSLRSDEWNECVSRGSPSQNLPYNSTSCTNVWDQQQYELGLHKGIISLKRYDSNYNRVLNEIVSPDLSYVPQAYIRQMNCNPEVQSNYHIAVTTDQKHSYVGKLDSEVMDHVAEVEKAFDFVNKTESPAIRGQQCSQESLRKPLSPHTKTSLYHDLEREYHKSSNGDIPVHFSPVVYSPLPSAGEQSATYEHKNPITKSATFGTKMIATDPMATSTPVDGSPATNSHMYTSVSHMFNRSGISSITASTAHEIVQLQQSDIELQTIKQEIMIQEGQIAQASLALTHCKKNNGFNGTLVELSAQRGLLLARERLLALQNEMQRLKTRRLVKESVLPLPRRMRGAIDLTSINVYLNRNFCIRNIDENVSYAFVILLKTDEQVEATQTVTLMDTRALRISKVHFSDQIRFTNLPVDFTVLLEIYALKVSENRRSDDYSCNMLKNKAKSLLSPSKKACGNESIVGSSEFTCCGHICLNRDTIGMQKFYLDGAVYPLEGTVEVESRCTTLPPTIEIDFRGFLTMYQIIAGLGSWARYWAVLRCGVVQFWKYPDDEASEKPSLACMDLSKCTDKEINHASHEICSRPNAFTVDLLVPKSPSLIEKKRVLLSADTKELCSAWLNALNGTLERMLGNQIEALVLLCNCADE
ncbi:Anillin-like protein 2 [Dirofilaria immitis]|nr:Anillin-like protein 2 [Dirofilaria immitis]